MKKSIFISILAALLACEEEGTGSCTGFDENNQRQACFGDKTREECQKISSTDQENLDWSFEEGMICSPPLPEK